MYTEVYTQQFTPAHFFRSNWKENQAKASGETGIWALDDSR